MNFFYLNISLFILLLLTACSEKKGFDIKDMQEFNPKGCSVQKLNDCSKLELDRCQIKSESCDSKNKDTFDFGESK